MFKIGVFGSAAGKNLEIIQPKAFAIGQEIARRGGITFTGGCTGLPHMAALGASSLGGIVIGVSPAMNLRDHVEIFKFPAEPYILIFTGFEKKGRNIINIRTCDAGIYISGRSGTLDEFLIMYDEGSEKKVIGLLSGTGGVVDDDIPHYINGTGAEKPSKTIRIVREDPAILVERVFQTLHNLHVN